MQNISQFAVSHQHIFELQFQILELLLDDSALCRSAAERHFRNIQNHLSWESNFTSDYLAMVTQSERR